MEWDRFVSVSESKMKMDDKYFKEGASLFPLCRLRWQLWPANCCSPPFRERAPRHQIYKPCALLPSPSSPMLPVCLMTPNVFKSVRPPQGELYLGVCRWYSEMSPVVRQAYLHSSLLVGSFLGFTVYPFETVPHRQEGDCTVTMEVQRKWRPQQDLGDDCAGRHGIRLWNARRVCCLLGQSAPW